LRHVYVMLIVFISWAFFDAVGGFGAAFDTIGRMFGAGGSLASTEALYYLRSYALPIAVAVTGVTPLCKRLAEKVDNKKGLVMVLEPVVLFLILAASTAAMVDGSFNPFIYFRF